MKQEETFKEKLKKISWLSYKRIKNKFVGVSRKDVQSYWSNPVDKPNQPNNYVINKASHKYSKVLLREVKKVLRKEDSILELGCNVGRNLNYLYQEGYTNINGIEINKEAVKLMGKAYPNMKSKTKISVGDIESKIKEIRDKELDLIFTIAVLMHLPRDSDFVFKEMVRVTKKYIIIIESENCKETWTHYPRDYKKIFEDLGMKQIKEVVYGDYNLRVFKKEGRRT